MAGRQWRSGRVYYHILLDRETERAHPVAHRLDHVRDRHRVGPAGVITQALSFALDGSHIMLLQHEVVRPRCAANSSVGACYRTMRVRCERRRNAALRGIALTKPWSHNSARCGVSEKALRSYGEGVVGVVAAADSINGASVVE